MDRTILGIQNGLNAAIELIRASASLEDAIADCQRMIDVLDDMHDDEHAWHAWRQVIGHVERQRALFGTKNHRAGREKAA